MEKYIMHIKSERLSQERGVNTSYCGASISSELHFLTVDDAINSIMTGKPNLPCQHCCAEVFNALKESFYNGFPAPMAEYISSRKASKDSIPPKIELPQVVSFAGYGEDVLRVFVNGKLYMNITAAKNGKEHFIIKNKSGNRLLLYVFYPENKIWHFNFGTRYADSLKFKFDCDFAHPKSTRFILTFQEECSIEYNDGSLM